MEQTFFGNASDFGLGWILIWNTLAPEGKKTKSTLLSVIEEKLMLSMSFPLA